jgi:hypothetical protein
MRGCRSIELVRSGFLALLLALLPALGGCGGAATSGLFEITRLEAVWTEGRVDVACEQQLRLSSEARNALLRGVPLTLELELILRDTRSQTRVGREIRRYEVRYLPLSEHYRVSRRGETAVQTFPRLRHALAEMSRLQLSIATGALPAGDYEILARTRLDHSSMPPPMRLPVLFDPDWKHAAAWKSWPLTVKPAT